MQYIQNIYTWCYLLINTCVYATRRQRRLRQSIYFIRIHIDHGRTDGWTDERTNSKCIRYIKETNSNEPSTLHHRLLLRRNSKMCQMVNANARRRINMFHIGTHALCVAPRHAMPRRAASRNMFVMCCLINAAAPNACYSKPV